MEIEESFGPPLTDEKKGKWVTFVPHYEKTDRQPEKHEGKLIQSIFISTIADMHHFAQGYYPHCEYYVDTRGRFATLMIREKDIPSEWSILLSIPLTELETDTYTMQKIHKGNGYGGRKFNH